MYVCRYISRTEEAGGATTATYLPIYLGTYLPTYIPYLHPNTYRGYFLTFHPYPPLTNLQLDILAGIMDGAP